MDMSFATDCYFGPLYVPLSRLIFVVSLLFLIPCLFALLRTQPHTLRSQRLYVRAYLICFVAPALSVMVMALHWYAVVDYVSAMAYLVQGPSDPLLPVLQAELFWFFARPAITLTLLLVSLHLYSTRTHSAPHAGAGRA